MTRNAALVTRWGNTARGRETKALEVFMDFMTFWGKRATNGECSEPEVYFSIDGSRGFGVVKATTTKLTEIQDTPEYAELLTRGQLVVDDLAVETYVTGDEEIQAGTQRLIEAGKELGFV